MAVETVKATTISNAIKKAQAVQPSVLKLADGIFAVSSKTRPGEGYVISLYDNGHSLCECKGSEHAGYCYHRAAVGLRLSTIPAQFLGQPAQLQEAA